MKETVKEALDGTRWKISDSRNENVFKISRIEVNADINLITDNGLQRKLGWKEPACFIFASELSFSPGLSDKRLDLIRKMVVIKSKDEFEDLLQENNVQNVSHSGSAKRDVKDTRIDSHRYTGDVNINGFEYSIKAYCMVFHNNKNYYVVGFAEPRNQIKDIFDIDYDDLDLGNISGSIIHEIVS